MICTIDLWKKDMRGGGQEAFASVLERAKQKQLFNQKSLSQTKPVFDKEAPKPVLPKEVRSGAQLTFSDIPVLELARQLTLHEFDMYRKITPKEFLSLSWQKADKEIKSPLLLTMIRYFNKVSGWVVMCLLQESNLRKRAKLLKGCLKLIQECARLNNFNAVFALMAGLNSAPVHRLKKTWEAAGTAKQFEEWMALTSNRGSWKTYRQALHNADPPCIPYLGVYLSDLTFMEENSTFLENGYVNVFKCRKIADVISEIQQYQQKPYNLEKVPSIRTYLEGIQTMSEKLAFKESLKIEPREVE